MARSPVPPPLGSYSLGNPKHDAIDPLTGICTWRASIMDTTIQCKNLYKAKHHAEAYHAGDKGRTIDQVSKGYLLAKYPLVEEYRFFVQADYWEKVFAAAIREEEEIDEKLRVAAKEDGDGARLSILEPDKGKSESGKFPQSKDREKDTEVHTFDPTSSDTQATLSKVMYPLQNPKEGGTKLPISVEEDLISFD